MLRLLSMFTLCFSACATRYDPDLVFAAQAMPHHADEVRCDSAASFAAVVARHHVAPEETAGVDEEVSTSVDLMSRHPGLLADILSVARCDMTTPTQDGIFQRISLSYAAVLASSAAPTVEAGRSLWRLGEHERAGSLMNVPLGLTLQEEATVRVLGPALAALPAEERAAAVAGLYSPLDLVALADHEQALVDQLLPPLPTSTAGEWADDVRCRVALPGLLRDLRALQDLPPVERAAAWAAQDHAVCPEYDKPIAHALDRDLKLMRGLEGV